MPTQRLPFDKRILEALGKKLRPKAPSSPPQPKIRIRPLRDRTGSDPIIHGLDVTFEEDYQRWGGRAKGTKPEYIVWRWLTNTKQLVEGVDFQFQSGQFGGRIMFGGVVVDFFFPGLRMAWRVQGERFHLLETADRVRDLMDKQRLFETGFDVIDLWAEDLETRPNLVLGLAWQRRELNPNRGFE